MARLDSILHLHFIRLFKYYANPHDRYLFLFWQVWHWSQEKLSSFPKSTLINSILSCVTFCKYMGIFPSLLVFTNCISILQRRKVRLQHGLPKFTQLVANIAGNKIKHLDPSLALVASSEIHSAWVFSDKWTSDWICVSISKRHISTSHFCYVSVGPVFADKPGKRVISIWVYVCWCTSVKKVSLIGLSLREKTAT